MEHTPQYLKNFSEWRNEGAKRAKNNWLFYVDSDEEVTSQLKNNIYHSSIKKISFFIFHLTQLQEFIYYDVLMH